jgi:3-phosphoshikimate 1-carboxyvinyltransferase
MPLPDVIEIVPLDKPVRAEITVPGSKSITNRALILAALADGEVTLTGALWSEDTQVMTEALVKLGFAVRVEADPAEFCNRTIAVKGLGGRIPNAGSAEQPLELFVGNAGTAARFLAAMVCLGNGVYRLSGVPRMHERPQAALFKALRELGYRVDSANDKLPAVIFGQAPAGFPRPTRNERGEGQGEGVVHKASSPQPSPPSGEERETVPLRSCTVSISESSQFASALLLSAKHGGWKVTVAGEDDEEAPYVKMTEKLVEVFPWGGGKFQIEPDASSGSYFWGANWLVSVGTWMADFLSKTSIKDTMMGRFQKLWDWIRNDFPPGALGPQHQDQMALRVTNWPDSGWQIDAEFPSFLPLPERISREGQLGDSIMTSIVIGADLWGGLGMERREKGIRFTDLGRLRVQECERVAALRTELTKCGGNVVEEGDTLIVYQTKLHGAEIETYNDHRMAMCFAILGLKVPGIKLKNPACVKKTFPNFFQKLAAAPPHGLGVEIRDGHTGRKLGHDELFAE